MARSKSISSAVKKRAAAALEELIRLYPEPKCALEHRDAFELLVATILSAQCTDAMVNRVTPALFARFPGAADLASAELVEVESLIKSTGFYHNKAKNLIAMASDLVRHHGGKVPDDLAKLTNLAGVGRKTAHVVLGNAFGQASGVVVDTHVKRLSGRIGLTNETDPVAIEHDLARLIPREHWIDFSHRLIEHGRRVCDAKKPACDRCTLATFCPRNGVDAKKKTETKPRKSPST